MIAHRVDHLYLCDCPVCAVRSAVEYEERRSEVHEGVFDHSPSFSAVRIEWIHGWDVDLQGNHLLPRSSSY